MSGGEQKKHIPFRQRLKKGVALPVTVAKKVQARQEAKPPTAQEIAARERKAQQKLLDAPRKHQEAMARIAARRRQEHSS